MTVETVASPQDLNVANPAVGDALGEGDNHLRIMKVAGKTLCWEHVGTAAFAAVSTIDTYTLIGAFVAGYDYHAVIESLYGSASGSLSVRVTTAGGTIDSGSNYAYSKYSYGGAAGAGNSSTTSMQSLGANFGDATDEAGHSEITIMNPQGGTNPKHVFATAEGCTTVANLEVEFGGGMYKATTAVDGLSMFSSGATLTGTLKLYRRFRPT